MAKTKKINGTEQGEVKVLPKDSQGKQSDNRTVEELVKLFDEADTYVQNNKRTIWDTCYKVYLRQRVDRHYDGIADPVIPETYTIVESLVANIAGGNPSVDYLPTNEEQRRDVEVLNGIFDYVMECNNMAIKQQQWVRESILYGTGVLHVSWDGKKPVIDNIAIRDFFVDPAARNVKEASYMGHRYLIDKDKLKKAKIFDPEKNKYVPRYSNLDKIGERSDHEGEAGTDKEYKELFSGSTYANMADQKQVEVIRIYDVKNARLIEIANRQAIIFNEPTPYQKPETEVEVDVEIPSQDPSMPPQMTKETKKIPAIEPFAPYAVLRNVVDPSLFYGSGDVEIIVDLQERLNDWEAIDMDVAAITAMPMFWVDPQFRDIAAEIEVAPGAVYPIPRNAIGQIDRPVLGVDIMAKKQEIMQQMRSATAADEAVQGVSSAKNRVTATEVQSQLNQATQRFSTKVTNFESEGYAQLASIIYKMYQLFVSTEQVVRIVGPQGVAFKDYDPYEFNGDYEPHVKLETTVNQMKLEEGQKMNQLYQIMAMNPAYDQKAISQWMVKKIDPNISDKELQGLMAPEVPPEQQGDQDPTKEIMTVSYKDASPFVKAQIEEKMGLTPDPMHEIEAQTMAREQAAQQVMLEDPATDMSGRPLQAPGGAQSAEMGMTSSPEETGLTEPPMDPSMMEMPMEPMPEDMVM